MFSQECFRTGFQSSEIYRVIHYVIYYGSRNISHFQSAAPGPLCIVVFTEKKSKRYQMPWVRG